MFIDTHCHLDHPHFSARLSEVLRTAQEETITRFLIPGVKPEGWRAIRQVASSNHGVFPAYGVHPAEAVTYDKDTAALLREMAQEAVAIGEIGLDYLVTDVPRDRQIEVLRDQLRVAVETGLPVLIHCRKAFADLLKILKEEGALRVGGIMHAFSGSYETAMECVRQGFVISISGTVTFRTAVRPLDLVRKVPLDLLVLETDAPDLAPEPYRGSYNEPAYMIRTARKVAELKRAAIREVGEVTTGNALRVIAGMRPVSRP
jgi:TatD DNase family protein